MALSKIVSSSLANGSVSIASITDNTVTSAKLTSTGVVANSYGNTTAIPVITVDAQGRITNATTSSVSGVTGLSFTPANSTVTVSTSTTNFDAVVTSGNSTVQGLLKVIDSVSNTSTSTAASANSVTTAYQLAANAVSNATAYAATAYSNAVATAASDATTKAGTAYSNATSYADTVAGTAYSNAVSMAASDATTKAGTAYSNAISYANTIAYTAADTAYANAVTYANTKANAAYSNVFNGGTFSGAVVMQANLTANSVRMNGDLQIDGNLTVSGNTVSIQVTHLSVEDNMILLNSNSTITNPDLGFAGNYNDGSYAHAGLFRDATDGVWKFFHGYTPEPDASLYIDTSNTSFALSNLQINYVIGNVTGSANSATYLGGNTAATLRSYSDTMAGTAYSNATTYAATIAGTAYSNAVSVAASDATTKAGTAYSNATTYAATIAGTAYSNAVSVAASDATTKAGTAYSNATTYAATIAGTAYSNAVSVAASDATTKAGTAYSNAVAYAASNTYVNTQLGLKANLAGASFTGAIGTTSYIDVGTHIYLRGQEYILNTAANGWNTVVDRNGGDGWIVYGGNSVRAPIFYDSNDTGYYLNPNATSNFSSLYVDSYFSLYTGAAGGSHGYAGRFVSTQSGSGNFIPLNFASTLGNHSWGIIARFRIDNSGQDRPSIQFSSGSSDNRWNIGYNTGSDDNFRLTQNMGYRNDNATTDGWGTVRLEVNTSGNFYSYVDTRSPIYYDSDNTGYYLNPASGSNLNTVNANRLSAPNDGSITIGDDSTTYTYTDGSTRSRVYVSSAYPVVTINSTMGGGNANHGPTLQFAHNGYDSNRHWVIGTPGTGGQLDFGTAQPSNKNPHAGIAGYDGVTMMRMTTAGNIGLGGDWGTYGSNGNPSYPLHVVGIGYSDTSFRAPIYYDSADTTYYVDPGGYSQMNGVGSVNGSAGVGFGIFAPSSAGAVGAIMNFHRGGYYAVNFGLDSDNVLRIGGWSAAANRFQFDMSGNLTAAGNVTAYSDIRLKENIEVISDALQKVKAMRGVTFTRNDQDDKIKRHTGVIAQEVEVVMPEVVSEDNSGVKNVAYGNMVGLLIEAIKEQQKLIEILAEKVKVLESK